MSSNNYDPYVDLLKSKYSQPWKESITPYERVEMSIERRQPDRIPFDFWAVDEIINSLKETLSLERYEDVLQFLGIDCRVVTPKYIGPEKEKLPDGSYYEIFGSHRKKITNEYSTYEEYASYPLANAQSLKDIESYEHWPKQEYWDWNTLPEIINNINKKVRYHIRYELGGIFETAWGLYGLDKFLIDLIQQPKLPLAIMDCVTTILINNFKQVMEHAEGMIDMVYTYDDVATQNGLLMSEKMWRKYVLPFHQKLNKEIKKYNIKIMYHSCGAIYDLIDPLIDEMQIDVLNPLQPRAAKMNMRVIKENFGSKVSFHGAIDIQHTMPHGTIEEVQSEAMERCKILGEGGGYICTTAHYIQADTPIENILALYATDRYSQ